MFKVTSRKYPSFLVSLESDLTVAQFLLQCVCGHSCFSIAFFLRSQHSSAPHLSLPAHASPSTLLISHPRMLCCVGMYWRGGLIIPCLLCCASSNSRIFHPLKNKVRLLFTLFPSSLAILTGSAALHCSCSPLLGVIDSFFQSIRLKVDHSAVLASFLPSVLPIP